MSDKHILVVCMRITCKLCTASSNTHG